ncbi:MAG: penicillin-binding protein 2 [Chloroflexi bacterium]|nr:penicillin-binding protein 2 [Chloroflexota bacterium]MBP8054877.1 penicillin-binding protein 2 [Chloroflexota bacterium]
MNAEQIRRLWMVIIGIGFAALIIVGRLIAFQAVQGPEWAAQGERLHILQVQDQPNRGIIYDRNGAVLAANSSDYQIGVSPNLVLDAEQMATTLAPYLNIPRYELLDKLNSEQPYELLAGRVTPQVADAIRGLGYEEQGLQIEPIPRRIYPQGQLLCHVLGYTTFDGLGSAGVEGYYQNELAGEAASAFVNISPLTEQPEVIAREGDSMVLTIDRSIQYLVEQTLQGAILEHGAQDGTIIVMDPRSGAILAMASTPCFDPNTYYQVADPSVFLNPATGKQYEPGSVMKLVTMAAALDSGTVTPQTTYYDSGMLQVGGVQVFNWDRGGYGETDMTTLLINSLNVGAATIATWMGPETFYTYLDRFGFGRPTGIDLMAEASGVMNHPGDELWTEAEIATNSFGQGLAVTPLQMVSAVSAIANNGVMMQPYLVQERQSANGELFVHQPTVLSRPISAETAQILSTMAVSVVARGLDAATVEGYTVAGKSGTAQIPVNGIYDPVNVIASFIGWLPADNPELLVFVILNKPTSAYWGSQTAAPVFSQLVSELVVMLDIPPDTIRLQAEIAAARGQTTSTTSTEP